MPGQRRNAVAGGKHPSVSGTTRVAASRRGPGFKTQIVRNSVLLAIVPMAALLVGTLRYQYVSAINDTHAYYSEELNDYVGSLNNDLSLITQRARSLVVNRAVFSGLMSYLTNDIPGVNAFQHTFDILLEDIRLSEGAASFRFYFADYAGLQGGYVRDMADFPDPELLQRILQSSMSEEVWSGRPDRPGPHITLYRNMTPIVHHPAVLRADVPYSGVVSGVGLFEDPAVVVLHFTQFGRLVYPADGRFDRGTIREFAREHRYHLVSNRLRVADRSAIYVLFPRSISTNTFVRSAAGTTGVFLLLSLFIVLVARAISKRITRDLEFFIDQLNATDLRAPLPESFLAGTAGELGVIKRKFIDVIDQLNATYTELIRVRETRDVLEIELLQERINPHLLYNSLAEITWLAHERNDTITVNLIDALVNYYRIILNHGSNVITIDDEVRLVHEYVRILNVIHHGRYELIADVDSRVLPMFMLKHVLQPLVENSIVHGIQNRPGAGQIRLTGRLDGDMVIFEIADDGVGLPEWVLAGSGSDIARSGETSDTGGAWPAASAPTRARAGRPVDSALHSGYGLHSIRTRLATFYQEPPYMVFENAPQGGAIVRVGVRARTNSAGLGPAAE